MKRSVKTVLYAAIVVIAATSISCSKEGSGSRYHCEGVKILLTKFTSISEAHFSVPASTVASPEYFDDCKIEWLDYKENADEVINYGSYATEDDFIDFLLSRGVAQGITAMIASWLDLRGNIIISDTDENDPKYKLVWYYEKPKR